MRIWTMLLSLVVMVALAVDVSAAGRSGKGGGSRTPMTFAQLAGSDDATLTKDKFVAARTKDAPADQAEQAKTRAEGMWDRLVKAADGKTELKKADYEAAMKKVMEELKSKGGGKRGGK